MPEPSHANESKTSSFQGKNLDLLIFYRYAWKDSKLASPEKLATLFQEIDKKIFMNQFNDKLEVQKITYLAQEYGIDLGYEFAWNGRGGPYCKQVSEHAHAILDSDIDSDWANENVKLRQFAKMMRPYCNNTDWLEIAASLVYLRKDSYKDKKLEQIIGYLIEDLTCCYKNFNETLVRRVIADMLKIGIFA